MSFSSLVSLLLDVGVERIDNSNGAAPVLARTSVSLADSPGSMLVATMTGSVPLLFDMLMYSDGGGVVVVVVVGGDVVDVVVLGGAVVEVVLVGGGDVVDVVVLDEGTVVEVVECGGRVVDDVVVPGGVVWCLRGGVGVRNPVVTLVCRVVTGGVGAFGGGTGGTAGVVGTVVPVA